MLKLELAGCSVHSLLALNLARPIRFPLSKQRQEKGFEIWTGNDCISTTILVDLGDRFKCCDTISWISSCFSCWLRDGTWEIWIGWWGERDNWRVQWKSQCSNFVSGGLVLGMIHWKGLERIYTIHDLLTYKIQAMGLLTNFPQYLFIVSVQSYCSISATKGSRAYSLIKIKMEMESSLALKTTAQVVG